MQKGNVNGALDLITNKPAVVTEWTILESPLLKIYPTAYAEIDSLLRILTGKKHPKIKLQRSRKIRVWTFGSLLHHINSFYDILKLKQIFQKS